MRWTIPFTATAVAVVAVSSPVFAQTTAGTSATIVIPVTAQTASYSSEVTVYNPNVEAVTIDVAFYDAQNTASPGAKPCSPLVVGGGLSTQFSLAGQCTLPAGSNFGLLILAEQTGTYRFYGYARAQTPQGIGFSTEGFPIENFNDQVQHVTGLKRTAAAGGSPAYQTNCFVTTLGDVVNYELRLFDGTSNSQLGGTLSGSLGAWQQYRYLDVFGAVGAPAGDQVNVRAQFSNLTGATKKLVGFCTVQENATFSADFRVAKAFGGTPQNAFVQGGNAFGTTAVVGTIDNQALDIQVNGASVMTYLPNATSPNIIGGHPNNDAAPGAYGQTIAGGGAAGSGCWDPVAQAYTRSCGNRTNAGHATVGGGLSNRASAGSSFVGGGQSNTASGLYSAVAGGHSNAAIGYADTVAGGYGNETFGASGQYKTVGGGYMNVASGSFATVVGGWENTASGTGSTVSGGAYNIASGAVSFSAGQFALADQAYCAVFSLWSDMVPVRQTNCLGLSNVFRIGANHGFAVDYYSQRVDGGGTRWLYVGDAYGGQTLSTWTGGYLSDGGQWTNASDRDQKTDFAAIDAGDVLAKVVALPITQWRYRNEAGQRHLGPVAQDFHAAFGLGADDKHIGTVDEGGVALAAIQGLNAKVEDTQLALRAEIQAKDAEIGALRQELVELRRVVDVLLARTSSETHVARVR